MMNNIKNVFLYNDDLYKYYTKKKRNKKIIWSIISLFIVLVSTMGIIHIITNDIIKNLIVLYFILMVLAIIFIFVFMYNIFLLTSLLILKVIFSDRTYAVTNSDEIITFKYKRNSTYFRYNVLNGNLLDEIVKILTLQISISKENKEMIEKIKSNNMALNDLYECLKITNVYKIKEKEDCIDIVCDYVDLIRNTFCKKQSLTIYKYYKNWEELLNKLKIQKDQIKKSFTLHDGEHSGFVDFVIKCSLKKFNAIFFHAFFTFVLICATKEEYLFAIWLEIAIANLIGILYSQKRALKYLYHNDNDTKEFLLNKIKNNKIVLVIYSMLLLYYSIMNVKEIPIILITAIGIFVILFIIKKKIET